MFKDSFKAMEALIPPTLMKKTEFARRVRENESTKASSSGLIEALNCLLRNVLVSHVWEELLYELSRDFNNDYYQSPYIDGKANGQCWVSPKGNKIFVNCGSHERFVSQCLGLTEGVFERHWIKITGYSGGNLTVFNYCARVTKQQKDIIMELENTRDR